MKKLAKQQQHPALRSNFAAMTHEHYMERCIELARHGLGQTRTNPLVGSVIVHNNSIIGEGYHRSYGGPHAEVNAIASVRDASLLEQSTLYVNLEPCSHHGKTPPCADLILHHRIPRVVYGMSDPFPAVAGKGLERLRAHGVEVIGPISEHKCILLNQRFLCHVTNQRPWILLKWAQSSDGFMDILRHNHEQGSFSISGELARCAVHTWRAQEDAILIGVQTAITDIPRLDVRYATGKQPLRVVIDPHQRLPQQHPMLHDGLPILLIHQGEKNQSNERTLFTDLTNGLEECMHRLLERGIASVLVEGGQKTLTSFIAQSMWDEARVIVSKKKLTEGLVAPALEGQVIHIQKFGTDNCHVYHPIN